MSVDYGPGNVSPQLAMFEGGKGDVRERPSASIGRKAAGPLGHIKKMLAKHDEFATAHAHVT